VGTLPYSRTILTPRAINQLLAEHPQLDISTIEGPYNSLVASLRSGEIDLIIGAIRPKESAPHLKTETLFDDKLAILARSDHPLTKKNKLDHKALETMQWVLPPTGTPTRQLFDQYCEQRGLSLSPHAIETSSASMVRGLLLESDRVALLSEHQIYYDKKLGALTALAIDLQDTYRPIGITLLTHIRPSPATQLFLNNLRSVAKTLPIDINHAR
jgi:LysR family transcriptional regulator of gallate degradation